MEREEKEVKLLFIIADVRNWLTDNILAASRVNTGSKADTKQK